MHAWSLHSWLNYTYQQTVDYTNNTELMDVLGQLSAYPPLVTPRNIMQLKHAIASAGRGECFILQGGDCAESFQDCHEKNIYGKLNILDQMSIVLQHSLRKPIVQLGRMAGQYAKPRSSHHETINGISLPSYRGDLINSSIFNADARQPNPQRLLQGYHYAAKTLCMIHHFYANKEHSDFFTSHEALHLHYEQALTRYVPQHHGWFNLSTHLPWIGMRTGHLDSAHVEFLRGVENPIGIKIGPDATPAWLCKLVEKLNPKQEQGRLLLISRMGAQKIQTHLPELITAVRSSGIPVTWSCDPMHGNTEITSAGIKTRHFDTILLELQHALMIHHELNSPLGGVHFELTGEHVTECLGGTRDLRTSDLHQAYHSLVDPRLNDEQSLEMASQLGQQVVKLTTSIR